MNMLPPDWKGTLARSGRRVHLMRRLRWIETLLLGALTLEYAVSIEGRRILALSDEIATNETVGQDPLHGRDVLVAGENAVVDGKSPAVITIDLGSEPVPPRANLELLLAPVTVFPNERYLIVVSIGSGGTSGAKRLGTASFFPPRPGLAQAFYFSVLPILAEMNAQRTSRINLSIALVSVDRSKSLEGSAVRIVGVRILGI